MAGDDDTVEGVVAVASLEMGTAGPRPVGALVRQDGTRLPFSGWSEFAAVVEDWRVGSGPEIHRSGEEE
jgi:hypothetical protein